MSNKIFALLFLIAFTLPGCEKDDICDSDTDTTPRLVIKFFNAANREEARSVTDLKVIAEGSENGIAFNPTATGDSRYITNADNIKIPLPTSADTVKYFLTFNYGNENESFVNTDTIQFNYQRHSVFVSRACGYSIYFSLNNTSESQPFILNDNAPDSPEAWIKDIDVVNYNLTNENETHLNIYF